MRFQKMLAHLCYYRVAVRVCPYAFVVSSVWQRSRWWWRWEQSSEPALQFYSGSWLASSSIYSKKWMFFKKFIYQFPNVVFSLLITVLGGSQAELTCTFCVSRLSITYQLYVQSCSLVRSVQLHSWADSLTQASSGSQDTCMSVVLAAWIVHFRFLPSSLNSVDISPIGLPGP